MVFKKPEKKIDENELRENFLKGPANEPIENALDALRVGKIVLDKEIPKLEKVTFRNQRDPGYPLEFHYASKTHTFKQYKLIDGESYTLPVEVIRNLEQCRENIEKYRHNSKGIPEIYIAGYKSHFICERVA